MKMKKPAHPGEVLSMMYLEPLNLTVTEAAAALDMPRSALSEIVNAKRSVTPQVAMKLEKAFGQSARFWLNIQTGYDLANTNPLCVKNVREIAMEGM